MINWKLRLQNKTTLLALLTTCIAFIYSVLGIFGIVPPVGQSQVVNLVSLFVELLAGLGIVVDPTTAGAGDSDQALEYSKPKEG